MRDKAATDRGESKTRQVNSVVYALAALRLIAASNRPLGVTEIARAIEMSPSSCFNVLKTLVSENFLSFDASSKKYMLGSGALELSNRTSDAQRLFADVRSDFTTLAVEFDVTIGFWEVREDRLILTGVVDSEAVIRIQMIPGQRLPIGGGAMGRAVAAARGLRGRDLADHIADVRWYRQPTLRTYQRDVAQAGRQGWAVDNGQFLGGVTTIASTISAARGDVRYCIAASGFEGQVSDEKATLVGSGTHECARHIEAGWFGYDEEAQA